MKMGVCMKDNFYLENLSSLYSKDTFKRKAAYIKYNFDSIIRTLSFEKDAVLEIGPGMGEFVKLISLLGGKKIDIIDNDKSILEYIEKKYHIRYKYLTDNISSMDNKLGKYKLIMMIQVFEHIPVEQYKNTIDILFKHLEINGYIVIVVPNANNPVGLTERYHDLQHQNSFTTQSLKELLRISGIKNYEYQIKNFAIPPTDIVNIIRKILQKILHLILLAIMIINGGVYYNLMAPNIVLIVKKDND